MIRRTRILALTALVAGTLTLALAGGGVATAQGVSTQAGVSKAQQQRLELLRTADVSTQAGVNRLLLGLGINPRYVVVQRGARNYAGPNCPGKGWTCTKAKRVLQAGMVNDFECSPGTGGSPPDNCSVVQPGGGSARCVERSTESDVIQKCSIHQGPSSGDNRAEVIQVIDQKAKGSATQNAAQKVIVTQDATGDGSNVASVKQVIKQKIEANASGPVIEQSQRGRQSVDMQQTSDAGDNLAEVSQSQDQNEQAAKATTINQFQNTDEGGVGVCDIENECYEVVQESNTGDNTTELDQKLSQFQHASNASGGQQAQGECDTFFTPCIPDPFASGLGHDFSQNSSGVSEQHSDQDENQAQHRNNTGTMTFSQVGPVRKDFGSQSGNAGNTALQLQSSKQDSKGAGTGVITDLLQDTCSSSGNCTVFQRVDSNGNKVDNTQSGNFIFAEIACGDFGESESLAFLQEEPPFCVPSGSSGGD